MSESVPKSHELSKAKASSVGSTMMTRPQIHWLENIFMGTFLWHEQFDQLCCYLQPQGTPNKYTLKTLCEYEMGNVTIDLTSDYPDFPAPLPILLAIHQSCAIVTHWAGVAKYMDLHPEEDDEDHAVLSGIKHESLEDSLNSYEGYVTILTAAALSKASPSGLLCSHQQHCSKWAKDNTFTKQFCPANGPGDTAPVLIGQYTAASQSR
ncbi:hypothetical protein DACRYDRAFT_17373 [Dacryopinax primogenitus]|uniref:Uncharacterized protein n=1 Tax=Dacryopinax primogenitus (strain DJM 731) TaxID=1858805 RepID=M5FVW2_DACPD|nr:uncharacterized protein DACRYDRAFT_17373 [Dacryopinax primogenitus]EJT99754.1 hypothetical protein DACRYDRAFT_17373 [Dacryopinax primogenitus]